MVDRVVVAMSGGVDSAVAALLLHEQGYEVIGVTLRLWSERRPDIAPHARVCCSLDAADDARRVCQVLGVPHYVVDGEALFRRQVVEPFAAAYAAGHTPNPCLACNRFVKFDFLLNRARALDAFFLATGHYAQVREDKGAYHLLKGVDPAKDQSYALYMLGQAQLRHLRFPLGRYHKAQVRQIAADRGLPVATKAESQEICFVPDNDYGRFVAERYPTVPGAIVDRQGRVLGRHAGIARFTVGQRRGLGISSPSPLYVLALDAARNEVIVGPAEELARHGLCAEDVHFVSGVPPAGPFPVEAKIRYRAPAAPATLWARGDQARLCFARSQRAISPGQAVVFYEGDEVLGGGTIARSD